MTWDSAGLGHEEPLAFLGLTEMCVVLIIGLTNTVAVESI